MRAWQTVKHGRPADALALNLHVLYGSTCRTRILVLKQVGQCRLRAFDLA